MKNIEIKVNKYNHQTNRKAGFIALISAVIIAAILLGFTATFGANSFHSRFDTLNGEFKRISLGLAESCVNTALLKVAQDYNYNYLNDPLYDPSKGGVVIPVDSNSNPPTECIIKSVTLGAEDSNNQKLVTITTAGEYNNANSSISTSALTTNPNVTIARANLFVVTQFINNNGGTLSASTSSINISPSSNPSPSSSFPGSELGVLSNINANTPYTVTGNNVAGYSRSADCTGTGLSAGATATCLITYDDIPTTGTISVIPNITNNDGGVKTASNFKLYIDNSPTPAIPGQAYTLSPGSHTVKADSDPDYSVSTWGGDCSGAYNSGTLTSLLQVGQNKTCSINFNDNPPPTPECADTVMMLDRTASMTSSDISAEKSAAIGLLNLYSPLSPAPNTAVGVFGGVNSEPYLASIVQTFTNNYTTLINAVNSNLTTSNTYTNLQSAIDKGQAELTRATDGKAKVLILLSDGGANRPCPSNQPNCGSSTNGTATAAATTSANTAKAAGTQIYTIHYGDTGTNYSDQSYLATLANNSANDHIGTFTTPTGFMSPTSNSADNGTSWVNPTNAYAIGGSSATDTGGNKQRYYNFNFPTFTNGTTINGVEVKANASVTDNPLNALSSNIFSSFTGNFTQWIPVGTSNDFIATSDNTDTTYIDTTPLTLTHTFKVPVISIQANSVIDSVNINVRAKSTTTGSPIQFIEEKDAAHVLGGATQTLTTTYTKYTYSFTTKPDGTKWLPVDLNPWLTSFGIRANAGKPVQVSQVYITITYH